MSQAGARQGLLDQTRCGVPEEGLNMYVQDMVESQTYCNNDDTVVAVGEPV